MAIIKIHDVKVTPQKAIDYAVKDKIGVAKKDDVKDSIDYATADKNVEGVVHKTISTALRCSLDNASKEWESVRNHYGKNDKILMYHVMQNFGVEVEPEIANEIGCKLAEELFSDFQCIVSTHTNTSHTHNHIVFNAVSYNTGNKYYDTLKSYKKMRNISDRLCEEYGLPVLEHTKDFRLAKYKDAEGNIRYFEPTDRKGKIREGEYADASDYRNTQAYSEGETLKRTNREVIKSDIDTILPTVRTYDALLEKLGEIGYEVKSKKTNGDWLAHVSFKAPYQEKFTRDYKIGDDYTREKLSLLIESNALVDVKERDVETDFEIDSVDIPAYRADQYQYGKIEIDSIDEYRRKRRLKESGKYETVKRGVVERLIIQDTKKLNKQIDSMYWESVRMNRPDKEQVLKNRKNQYLLDCINANLKTLNFVESKNIQSFKQINGIVTTLYDKRNRAQAELDKIRFMLKKANENIVLIQKANDLRKLIDIQKANSDYVQYELDSDMDLLNSYESILAKRNLSDVEQQVKFTELLSKYNDAFNQLSDSLKVVNEQIREYDDCVYTLHRVDKDNRQQYENDVKEYYNIKESQKDSSKKKQDRGER